jgi:hypothetical protein
MSRLPSHPRLALPFTFLTGPDRVRLVAGEDFRLTLEGPGLDQWLPAWLAGLDGREALEPSLERIAADCRTIAREILARLVAERGVVEAPASAAHRPGAWQLRAEGSGPPHRSSS